LSRRIQRRGFAGFGSFLVGAGTRTAGQWRGTVQTAEIDDHDKKPLGIWTLAMFSALPAKTLGPFINERANASACPAWGTV
jgi:hypothetical protein